LKDSNLLGTGIHFGLLGQQRRAHRHSIGIEFQEDRFAPYTDETCPITSTWTTNCCWAG
jgi:hypothetical protein